MTHYRLCIALIGLQIGFVAWLLFTCFTLEI